MSGSFARSNSAAVSAASRDKSLLQLLDPNDLLPGHTTADLYSLRHLTLRGGLPDTPTWLRAQAWKVLLGYLPPEKKEWSATLAKRRREYYQFLDDFAPPLDHPPLTGAMSEEDGILDQIYKDLSRSRKNGFAFYQAVPRASSSCPISPLPEHETSGQSGLAHDKAPVQRLSNRHNIVRRLSSVNRDFAQSLYVDKVMAKDPNSKGRRPSQLLHYDNATTTADSTVDPDTSLASATGSSILSPPILLSPPSPGGISRSSSEHSFTSAADTHEDPPLTMLADQMSLSDAATSPSTSSSSPTAIHQDRNWHSLLRILYLFALLNPSIGYVQGMNEALFTLVYVFGSANYPSQDILHPSHSAHSDLDTSTDSHQGQSDSTQSLRNWNNEADLGDLSSHAEADAFWCFSTLIAEVRDLYEFEGLSRSILPTSASTGMADILNRFSLRLKWLDKDLWTDLHTYNLDPRLPHYSVRWLACLLSTELSLPSVTRIWDALLAEQEQVSSSASAKIEFLIDVSCAMLINVKDRLPRSFDCIGEEQEAFSYGMHVLQSYPDEDISPVLELATLFRQRRLAADLTGDGPPLHDDEADIVTSAASVKTRATQVLRDWANSGNFTSARTTKSPQLGTPTNGRWFGSIGIGQSANAGFDMPDTSFDSNAEDASAASTPSKASLSGMFAKYADAVQRSDAAANLSKTSTNLTAKAMARFGDRSSRESTPEASSPGSNIITKAHGSRIASLGTVSAGMFNRSKRSVSTSTSASVGTGSPRTPDMNRWSEDVMPDFPLPNVSDSPAGRMEYVDTSGKRISSMHGRLSGFGDPQSDGANPPALPSMRAAAQLGLLSRRREPSGSSSGRIAGPKPLLLSQSARPPREPSNGSGHVLPDEPSRKVSSGPMAQNMSRGNSHQDGQSSVAESLSGRSSRSHSRGGSRRSSVGSPELNMDGLQQAGKLPPLPSLVAQNGDSPNLTKSTTEVPNVPRKYSVGSIGLQGLQSTEGKVPAGAFGRSSKANLSTDTEIVRPAFGHVSSSSDVPLVAAGSTSISRPRLQNRKRTSGSTIDSRSASISGSVAGSRLSNRFSLPSSTDEQFSSTNFDFGDYEMSISQPMTPDADKFDDARPISRHTTEARPDAKRTWSVGEAVRLQDAPMPDEATTTDSMEKSEATGDVRRYALSDEPLELGASDLIDTKPDGLGRAGQSSTSSVGVSRTKRLTQARTGSSSSGVSRRSLASIGAGLRRSSRTSVHEQTASSPKPLPELEEDASANEGIFATQMDNKQNDYPGSRTTNDQLEKYAVGTRSSTSQKHDYVQPEYEDGANTNERHARRSQDSYTSAAGQNGSSFSAHQKHGSALS